MDDCLSYIEGYWKNITFSLPRDRGIHIGLPKRFVVPNSELFKKDQFYWDSYFTIQELIEQERIALSGGMIDNCSPLQKNPAGTQSRAVSAGRTVSM